MVGFRVVLADGSLVRTQPSFTRFASCTFRYSPSMAFTFTPVRHEKVTADSCTNSDLFFALRGGGGGTFGVVVSAIYRVHPTNGGLFYSHLHIGTEENKAPVLCNHSASRASFKPYSILRLM